MALAFIMCNNNGCPGVVEFYGGFQIKRGRRQEFEAFRSYHEPRVNASEVPYLMVYKCSRCHQIEIRANHSYINEISGFVAI